MRAGPQQARVFASFASETCIFPAAAARPAQKCRVFTRHLMPPSDKAKRTGFRGCLAARKPRFFTGREHNGRKTTCFSGPTRSPLADPSPAGGAGPGCATPQENTSFRIKNVVLPRRQALRGAKTPCFLGPSPHPPAPPGPAEGRSGRYARGILHFRPKSIVFYRASWPAPNPARAQGRSTGKTRELRPEQANSDVFFLARPLPEKRVGPGP